MTTVLFVALVATVQAPAGILADVKPTSSSYSYNSLNGGYSYNWNVIDSYSGNDYGHREDRAFSKSGLDETKGSYHVLLPDGRVQTVTYYVDPYGGYQAKVLYAGEANYAPYAPQPSYHAQPAYTPAPLPLAPQPSYIAQPVYKPAPLPPAPKPVSFPTVAPYVAPVVTTTTPAPVEVKPAPVLEVVKPVLEPVYAPVNYAPANTAYPHNSVWNLVVPDSEHHKIKHLKEPKEVHPLAPPPAHHAQKGVHAHDPYLKTEAEVSNYDFSGPFFYSSTKNIIRKEKKDGKPKTGAEHGHEKIHEKPGAPHTYYRYY